MSTSVSRVPRRRSYWRNSTIGENRLFLAVLPVLMVCHPAPLDRRDFDDRGAAGRACERQDADNLVSAGGAPGGPAQHPLFPFSPARPIFGTWPNPPGRT